MPPFPIGFWKQVVSGAFTKFSLFGWGINDAGQVGDNTAAFKSSPVQIGTLTNWASISAGGRAFTNAFTLGIDTSNALWAWGGNGSGQLGRNNISSISSPVQVGTLTNWASVTTGYTTSLAIKTDSSLWAWGSGTSGQMGNNAAVSKSSPVQVGTLTNWATVSMSHSGSAIHAIDTAGQHWAWGAGSNGQLGNNAAVNQSSPVQIGTLTNWATVAGGAVMAHGIDTSGKLFGMGAAGLTGDNTATARSSPVLVGTLTNWSKVSDGVSHVIALKTNGTLWGWGSNYSAAIGNGTTINQSSPVQIGTLATWSQISAGGWHSLAIKTDGSLWGWGRGNQGQLADAVPPNASSPIQVGALTTWSKVSSSRLFTMAVDTSGQLWAWGNNNIGQLGTNNLTNVSSPVQVGTLTNWSSVNTGASHAVAIKTDGTLWGWGFNSSGQIGNTTALNCSSPTQVGTLTNWASAVGGASSTFAVKTDGTLWGWGANSTGVLGLNVATSSFSSPVQVGTLTNWTRISAKTFSNPSVSATKTDNTLWAWGYNGSGHLGLNDTTVRSSPVQVGTLTNWANVSMANTSNTNDSTVATKTDGTLWSWGFNNGGGLGIGSYTSKSSPVQVGTLTNWTLPIGSGGTNFATKTDGTLWGWGYNQNTAGSNALPRIGDNTAISKLLPVQIGTLTNWPQTVGAIDAHGGFNTLAVKTDNTLWGWGYRGVGGLGDSKVALMQSPVQIGTLTNWTSISAGYTSSEGISGS